MGETVKGVGLERSRDETLQRGRGQVAGERQTIGRLEAAGGGGDRRAKNESTCNVLE